MNFVSIHVVHSYSSIDTTATWKKSCFISSDRFDLHIINSLPIVVHVFTRHILTSLSVDEMLLPRYMSTNFRGLPFRVEMAPFRLKHVLRFDYIHVEANASCCLLLAMQQGFGLGRCIYKKRKVICIVCIHYSFYRISSASKSGRMKMYRDVKHKVFRFYL